MTAIRRDADGHPVISMYATDDETRAFTQALTTPELTHWVHQQKTGASNAQLAEDRASHARSAEIANAEIANRLHRPSPATGRVEVSTEPQQMTAQRLAAIEAAINSPAGLTLDDARALLAEALRARADSDAQHAEADYWRESYRLVKGLSFDELNAVIAVRDATPASHRAPCWFPNETCTCDDQSTA